MMEPEKPIRSLFQRLFTDEEFLARLESDTETTLREIGFEFTEQQLTELRQGLARPADRAEAGVGPATMPTVAVGITVTVTTNPQIQVTITAVSETITDIRRTKDVTTLGEGEEGEPDSPAN
jgi:hypothetical protein